ncbi:MAG: AsmA-like C-terminal region-containing protein [Bacteroidales bacterium]|nr:AsmA-like C-terminal region-containing protein [Bacteroidales bacterium]
MRRIRIILEYFAATLIILFLLSVITSVVIVKFYSDDIKVFASDLLNKHLNTEIRTGEIGISVLKKFPNTAIFFNDVVIKSGSRFNRNEFKTLSPDTLFSADRVYVQFSLTDLLRKEYVLKKMEAQNGLMRILIDSSGGGNFMIGHGKEKNGQTGLIEMNGITIKNIDLHFINKAKDIRAHVLLKEMFLEGDVFEQKTSIHAGGRAFVNVIMNHDVQYLNHQEINSNISVKIENNRFFISKGELVLGSVSAAISGSAYPVRPGETAVDLHFTGKKIGVELISHILSGFINIPPGIEGKGNFNVSVGVKGLTGPTQSPRIQATFSTAGASLDLLNPPLQLRSVSLKGSYDNGELRNIKSTSIELQSVLAQAGDSRIRGTFRLVNLLEPIIFSTISGDIIAPELQKYTKNLPIRILEGSLRPEVTINGTIEGKPGKERQLVFTPEGIIHFDNLRLEAEQADVQVRNLGGTVVLETEKWMTDISGYLNNTDFHLNLSINNPLSTITGSGDPQLEGTVYSSNIDIDAWINTFRKEEDGEQTIRYPEKPDASLAFRFDRITKGEIHTREVTGNLIYSYPNLYVLPLSMETMNGTISSNILLTGLDLPLYNLNMSTEFNHVEIGDIFRSFNNFGQDFLTHNHLSGRISGESEFSASIGQDMKINSTDIISTNSFTIENGRLTAFEPLIKLSDFLRIDSMDDVHFSNLSNTVLIRDNLITVPEMDIRSSAFNLKASGIHGFDKTYKYHVATKLSELLFSKAASSGKAEFNVALDPDDQRTIFLVIADSGNGTVVNFDEKRALRKIRSDLKEEKTELKTLLNEEFGIFKKDSIMLNSPPVKSDPVLRFNFSQEEKPDTIPSTEKEKSRWWKRKPATDKKPVPDFVFEDDDP